MLSLVRLRRVRCFLDSGDLELGKLNLLLGPNNAGKSTILHALAALKQTLETADPDTALATDGKIVRLGGYNDFWYRGNIREPASIRLGLNLDVDSPASRFVKRTLVATGRARTRPQAPNLGTFFFRVAGRTGRVFLSAVDLRTAGGAEELRWLTARARVPGGMAITFPDGVTPEALPVRAEHFLLDSFPNPQAPNQSDFNRLLELYMQIRAYCTATQMILRRMAFIGPLRQPIERFYAPTGESPESVGPSGENTAALLYTEFKRTGTGDTSQLLQYWRQWLGDEFGLALDATVRSILPEFPLLRLTARDGTQDFEANLADFGFGVSQVSPIIVQSCLAKAGDSILVEQPELHLHPDAQAHLANLFVDAASRGVQSIIETHSEHLVMRLRRLVARGEIAARDVRLFHLVPGTKGTRVRRLGLDDDGTVTNWPPQLFDQGYKEALGLAMDVVG
jgi:predicted ATPase